MGITRWPYRRIRYLLDQSSALECSIDKQDQEHYTKTLHKIQELQGEIESILSHGPPSKKNPPRIKVTGVAKRGRPKTKKLVLYEENCFTQSVEYLSKWHEETLEYKSVTNSTNDAPLGFHLNLNVEEISSIIYAHM
jgi:hypothetical protein